MYLHSSILDIIVFYDAMMIMYISYYKMFYVEFINIFYCLCVPSMTTITCIYEHVIVVERELLTHYIMH